MANKKFTYNVSGVITLPNGTIEKFATQLYEIGVYIISNNNAAQQGTMKPSSMEKMCKRIKKDLDAGKITNVEWGREITVEERDNGYYEV